MKDQNVFLISQHKNIPRKRFNTQNEPLNVAFQMRQTPPSEICITREFRNNHAWHNHLNQF